MFESPLQFPALEEELFQIPTNDKLGIQPGDHAPRFLMLYGSLRERSYSRLLTFEAARLLIAMGGEVKIFDPTGLPLVDSAPDTHPKVQELRQLALWAEGMVWLRRRAFADQEDLQHHLGRLSSNDDAAYQSTRSWDFSTDWVHRASCAVST